MGLRPDPRGQSGDLTRRWERSPTTVLCIQQVLSKDELPSPPLNNRGLLIIILLETRVSPKVAI